MHQGGVVENSDGDLDSWDHRGDPTFVKDSIAQDSEEGEFPLVQHLPGLLSTHADTRGKRKLEEMLAGCWKARGNNLRAMVLQDGIEHCKQARTLKAKLQPEIFVLLEEGLTGHTRGGKRGRPCEKDACGTP